MTCSKPTGRFTRFINEDQKIGADGKVKPRAFYPRPSEKGYISVFFTENLIENDVWDLGLLHIKPTMVGRADLDGCDVFNIGMCITIDNKVPKHAKLGPFPEVTTTSPREKIDERSQKAAKLADISNTKRYFPP